MIVLMELSVIYLALFLFGLILGSFAGASVWRIRARQLVEDKNCGEKVDIKEYEKLQKLTKSSLFGDRSKCLNCSYELKWYDLIPVLSWLSLGGKCRKCRKPIGYFEPIIEIGMAVFFVLSFMFWPNSLSSSYEITLFVLWLISGIGLAILFVYDQFWSLLPDKVSFIVIGIGVINAGLVFINSNNKTETFFSILGSVLILSGLYWIIYKISKGTWIGFGDIKLGLGLALMLSNWGLAFIALFAANLVGCILVLPAMIVGKLKRNSRVPFGPLLIIGYIIAGLFGNFILNFYFYNLI